MRVEPLANSSDRWAQTLLRQGSPTWQARPATPTLGDIAESTQQLRPDLRLRHPIIGHFLTVNTPSHALRDDTANGSVAGGSVRPLTTSTTETKPAFKTTEFAVYLVAVVGVLIASWLVGDSDGRGDIFLADKAWFYVTLLTVGYLVSRGLAKAGSRAHHDA